MNISQVAASNTGGPYVQNYLVVLNSSEIAAEVVSPTGQEIIDTFDHYIGEIGTVPDQADADFILDGGVLTNTKNSDSPNFLLDTSGYPAVYTSVRLSSTDTDDDLCGWVLGVKEDSESRYILFVSFDLQSSLPAIRLYMYVLPLSYQPNTGLPSPTGEFVTLKSQFLGPYPASNSEGLLGWMQPPWNQGIYVWSSFNGTSLSVNFGVPGAPNYSSPLVTWNETIDTIPELKGFRPSAGLFTFSQVNCFWSDYGFSSAGELALNLETQTVWNPVNGQFPLQFEDSGIPITDLIKPGRYARSLSNSRWLKVDPYSKEAALADPAPFV